MTTIGLDAPVVRADSCNVYELTDETMDNMGTSVGLDAGGNNVAVYTKTVGDLEAGARVGGLKANWNTLKGENLYRCEDVAVSSTKIVLGCPYYNGAGGVHVYDVPSNRIVSTLLKDVPVDKEEFGRAVAVTQDGSKILVGADKEAGADGSPTVGAVYLYNSAGELLHRFANPSATQYDYFGRAVAMNSDGSRIVIGGIGIGGERYYPLHAESHIKDPGVAFLYNADGTLMQTFLNPDPVNSGFFGSSVDINDEGDRVVIGAPHSYRRDAGNTGKAYIFLATSGSLLATLNSPRPTFRDSFGHDVSMDQSGTRVLVGAPYQDTHRHKTSGHAYLFDGTGNLMQILENPKPLADAHFGISVALDGSGRRALVGAPYGKSESAGRGYMICLDTEPAPLPTSNNATIYLAVIVAAGVLYFLVTGGRKYWSGNSAGSNKTPSRVNKGSIYEAPSHQEDAMGGGISMQGGGLGADLGLTGRGSTRSGMGKFA